MKLLSSLQFLKNNQISNFMKIRPLGALFHSDRRKVDRTDRKYEAINRFSFFFLQKSLKIDKILSLSHNTSLLLVVIQVAILLIMHLLKGSRNLCGT